MSEVTTNKKNRSKVILIVIGIVILIGVVIVCLFFGFGKGTELPNYHGDSYDEGGKVQFSTDLFYRNDMKAQGADPFVLDNTKRDGYYYLYVTEGYCFCYRSTDLVTWEPVGNTLATVVYEDEQALLTTQSIWAPEVIYDEDTLLYYMYFSAKPQTEENVVNCQMYAAVSESPTGPYEIVNFMDEDSCGEENMHDFDTKQYSDDFASYLFLDPERYNDFLEIYGGGMVKSNGGTYSMSIDPHPYVDPATGTKYMYFVVNGYENHIIGMEMENWLKPKWDTMTIVVHAQYYTIEDWENNENRGTIYESGGNQVNEGPAVVYHNGKYYMTISVGNYSDNSYSLVQAVGDSPLGPFRKLSEEENGQFLSGSTTGSKEVSGSGHHSFVTVGEQLYVIYHRHNDVQAGGGNRNIAVDEVNWITITDIYGEEMDVMYANGPTATVQPLTDVNAKYQNIAPEATVQGEGDIQYLTDDLLSLYKIPNAFDETYIKETVIHKTTTFTFDFKEAKSVRAIMVYASKNAEQIFESVDMEITYTENGRIKTGVIKDIRLSKEQYSILEFNNAIDYITPGANIFAEFDEKRVTSVKITVNVPKGQESVGISEIKILGKDSVSDDLGKNTKDAYTPKFGYEKVTAQTDEGFTIDGQFDEKEYETQRWLNLVKDAGDEWGNLKVTTYYGEKGVYLAFDVEEKGTIYVNPDRASYLNSGVELYMSNKGAASINSSNSFEIDMQADGGLSFKRRTYAGWTNVSAPYDIMPVLGATTKGGDVNTEECYGYSLELFIPYSYLEYLGVLSEGESVEELYLNPVLITSYSYDETDKNLARNWYNFATALPEGGWSRPDKNYHFDDEGLVAHNLTFTSNEGGTLSEKNGNDYAVNGSTIDLVVKAENGYTLDNFTINGEPCEEELVFGEAGAIYTASGVLEEMDIEAVFRKVSAENATVSGTLSYQGSSKSEEVLSDLKVELFDGYNFYPATLEGASGKYTASVPKGNYRLLVASSADEYTVADVSVEITTDTTKHISITDAMYGDTRLVTMKEIEATVGSVIKEFEHPINADSFVYGFKIGSDVQNAYSMNEKYVPQVSVYFGSEKNSLRLQVMKWGQGFYFKMAVMDNEALTSQGYVTFKMSDSVKNALMNKGTLQCYIVKNDTAVALYAVNDSGALEKITDSFDISEIASSGVYGIGLNVYDGVSTDYPAILTDSVLRGGTTDINEIMNE